MIYKDTKTASKPRKKTVYLHSVKYLRNQDSDIMIMDIFRKLAIFITLPLISHAGAYGQQPIATEPAMQSNIQATDSITVIVSPTTPAPDDIYGDESVTISGESATTFIADTPEWLRSENIDESLVKLGDTSHKFSVAQFAAPAATFVAASLFVKTPALVRAREYVQKHLSQHGNNKTEIDNYLQYLPMVGAYGLYFCGLKGQHSLLDRTILLAMSYATFAVLNNSLKYTIREQRPDSHARNSFPSGHTGTVVTGAEYLRREYWDTNKWVAMSGYVVALGVGYLRIHNDRHWINDVVGGAALGYLSTTFAYWIYPKIFRKRTRMHRDELLEHNNFVSDNNRRNHGMTWIAAPTVANGSYGVAASLTF